MKYLPILISATSICSAEFADVLNSTLNFYYQRAMAETPVHLLRNHAMPVISDLGPDITSQVSGYGCYCRYLIDDNVYKMFPPGQSPTFHASGVKGLDEVDGYCKQAINGLACLSFSGVDIEEESFSHNLFHVLKANTTGIKEHCAVQNQGDQDKIDLCIISVTFSVQIVNKLFSHTGLDLMTWYNQEDLDLICNPFQASYSGTNKWVRCCDKNDYPDRKVYAVLESTGCKDE